MSSAVIITAAAIALIVLPPKYNPRLCSWLHGNVLARAGALGKDPLPESAEFHRALGRSQHLDRALVEMRALLELATSTAPPLSRVHAVAIHLAVLRLRAAQPQDHLSPEPEPHAPGCRPQSASDNKDPSSLARALAVSTAAGPSTSAPLAGLSCSVWQCWLQLVACEEGLKRLADLRDGYRASKDRLERFSKAARVARAIQEAGIIHLVCSAESALEIAVESYLRSKQQFIRGLTQAEAQQHTLRTGLITVFTNLYCSIRAV